MKKIILASAFAAVIFLSGCEGGSILGGPSPDFEKPFDLTAEIKQNDFKATADIIRSSDDNWEFVFTEPRNIAGLVVKIDDGVYSASLDDLTFETESAANIYSTIPSIIAETLDAASEPDGTTTTERNGTAVISGNAGGYGYNISYDKADGMITKLEIPSQKLTVSFSEDMDEAGEADVTESGSEQ